jgi:hypothetical protein
MKTYYYNTILPQCTLENHNVKLCDKPIAVISIVLHCVLSVHSGYSYLFYNLIQKLYANIIIIVLFLCCHSLSLAQSVTGNWTSSVPANTITEAGNNYSANWTSLTNQSIISMAAWLTNYTVRVKKTDAVWHSDLRVWIHKTGDRIGLLGSVSPAGNTTYFELTATDQVFFTTSTGITLTGAPSFNIQYEIRGLSVLIPAQTYTTTIVYTISSP